MAKDDYFVIVSKILVYLYRKLRHEQGLDVNYIKPMSKDFPISEDYLNEVIQMLVDDGYISGNIQKAWGGVIIYVDYQNLKITNKGMEYLRDNSTIRKICEKLKDAESILSLFSLV